MASKTYTHTTAEACDDSGSLLYEKNQIISSICGEERIPRRQVNLFPLPDGNVVVVDPL